MFRATLGAGLLLSLAVAGAFAQPREPVIMAPLGITPPGADDDQKAREHLERERRDRPQQPIEESRGDRGLLGAPVFVPPMTGPFNAAPQYQPTVPAYGGPGSYGSGYGAPPGPTTARVCQQYAPAYDEAGRFLAHVCIR